MQKGMLGYKILKQLITITVVFQSTVSFAKYMPFEHDLFCQSAESKASIRIMYDKTKNLSADPQGAIIWEFHSGHNEQLVHFIVDSEIATDGYYQTIRRESDGRTGTYADFIEQSRKDPFLTRSSINGVPFYLEGSNRPNYNTSHIEVFTVKSTNTAFTGNKDGIETFKKNSYYIFYMKTFTREVTISFKHDECRLLN